MNCCSGNCNQGRACPHRQPSADRMESSPARLLSVLILLWSLIVLGLSLAGYQVGE